MLASSFQNAAAPPAMLLVGHGTRDPRGLEEFRETARLVAQRLADLPVESCFLELATPTISDAFARLVARGARQVVVSPLLLFAAGHAKRDIPRAVANAAQSHRSVELWQAQPLGCHDAIVRASAVRFHSALQSVERTDERSCDKRPVTLLMVGRGSLDASATAEMLRFTRMRAALTPVDEATTAFVAMAEPGLAQVGTELAAQGRALVVVQPHLLFHGDLLNSVRRFVEENSRQFPATRWVVAERLGVDALVVDAVVDRYRQACAARGRIEDASILPD